MVILTCPRFTHKSVLLCFEGQVQNWMSDEENPLSAPGLNTGNPADIADIQYLPKIRRRKDRSCLFSPLLSRLAKELTTASETRSLAMRDTSSASKVRREATRRVSSADRDAIVAAAAGHIAWNNKFYRRLDEIVARDPESESVISPRRVNVNGVETRPVVIRPVVPSALPHSPQIYESCYGSFFPGEKKRASSLGDRERDVFHVLVNCSGALSNSENIAEEKLNKTLPYHFNPPMRIIPGVFVQTELIPYARWRVYSFKYFLC